MITGEPVYLLARDFVNRVLRVEDDDIGQAQRDAVGHDPAGRSDGRRSAARGVGYVIAAAGPLALGAVHDAAGGWTVPIIIMLGVSVLTELPGLAAGRNRTVLPHRAAALQGAHAR